jgi:hypothetical protein
MLSACAGSLRENVDPLGNHHDAAIVDALKGVALVRRDSPVAQAVYVGSRTAPCLHDRLLLSAVLVHVQLFSCGMSSRLWHAWPPSASSHPKSMLSQV